MPEPEFKGNDPYKNYRFRVKWDGRYVAGVSKVSALSRTPQAMGHSHSSTDKVLPGQSKYEALTLERGVTHDANFEQWANKVWDYANSTTENDASNQPISLKDFRKDIVIEVFDEAGQKEMAYVVYRCWASEFTALPDLDATGNAVAIQSMRLENEGWERETSLSVEPAS